MTVAFVACGEGNSPEQSEAAKPTKPDVNFPAGPFPKELVIKDLEEGSGPGAEPGDTLIAHYVGIDKTGKERYSSWTRRRAPVTFTLNGTAFFPGWEQGVKGMKVGGRRELFIPRHLALGEPLVYVIDLLKIE